MTAQILQGSRTTFGTQNNNKGTWKQLSKNSVKICCMANTLKHASCCTSYVITHFQDRNKSKAVDCVLLKLYFFSLMFLPMHCRIRISPLSKCYKWASGKRVTIQCIMNSKVWQELQSVVCWELPGKKVMNAKIIVPVSLVMQAEVLMWLRQRAFGHNK